METQAREGVKVVVTGGRRFEDIPAIFAALDRFHAEHPIIRLAHGSARGVDRIAQSWAIDRGIPHVRYPVPKTEWDQFGPEAGNRRNEKMLRDEQPDWVIAFPGREGTLDCVTRAKAKGIKVHQPIGVRG